MLIIGSNHLISQTGWNRCNISLSLSLSLSLLYFSSALVFISQSSATESEAYVAGKVLCSVVLLSFVLLPQLCTRSGGRRVKLGLPSSGAWVLVA